MVDLISVLEFVFSLYSVGVFIENSLWKKLSVNFVLKLHQQKKAKYN